MEQSYKKQKRDEQEQSLIHQPNQLFGNGSLLELIFQHLDDNDLQTVSQVCKLWYGVIYRHIIAEICKDITRGREKKSYGVALSFDSSIQPTEFATIFSVVESLLRFRYTDKLAPGPGLTHAMLNGEGTYEWGAGCICDICFTNRICSCISNMKMVPYQNHKLKIQDPSVFHIPIIECNNRCKCCNTCELRVIQHGLQVDLEVFRTNSKNWGARVKEPLEAGSFVCEYVGEVISTNEAKQRHKAYDEEHRNYLIVIREHFSSTNRIMRTNIDGTSVGNIARFFNHSCEPNLIPVLVSR